MTVGGPIRSVVGDSRRKILICHRGHRDPRESHLWTGKNNSRGDAEAQGRKKPKLILNSASLRLCAINAEHYSTIGEVPGNVRRLLDGPPTALGPAPRPGPEGPGIHRTLRRRNIALSRPATPRRPRNQYCIHGIPLNERADTMALNGPPFVVVHRIPGGHLRGLAPPQIAR